MYRTIIVPLDGSPLAERALPFAVALGRPSGARMLLVRAALAHPGLGGDLAREEARAIREAEAYLNTVAIRLGKSDVVETATFYGNAAQAIIEEARLRKADLVVMSTHGRSGLGRWLYGSVADEVMRRASVPVLLVPAACTREWNEQRPLRIVVPLDGSPLAEEILGPVGELARPLGAELLLVRVIEPPRYAYGDAYMYVAYDPEAELINARHYLDDIAAGLRGVVRSVAMRTLAGDPAPTVASLAKEWNADTIAMATHGSGGLTRLVMGSVATGVVHHANVPIFVVRPVAVREPDLHAVTS